MNPLEHLGLPCANVPLEGVQARLLQLDGAQVLFMSFSADADFPEHPHEAQSGMVLSGRIDLTVAGDATYRRGDVYAIPAGVPHSARIHAGYADIAHFDEPDRYARSTRTSTA